MPHPLARGAVRSYRTVSPLPPRDLSVARSAVYSLLHFPSRRHAWLLASLLPVGGRTFLHPVPKGDETTILHSPPHTPSNRTARPEIHRGKLLHFKSARKNDGVPASK